jgi:enoyl reductase-like protein
MLKLFSIFTFLFSVFLSPSQAQDSPYYRDAVQLAARLSVDNPSAEISQHLIYSIEDALIAVSLSPSISANVVSHKYSIHASSTTNSSYIRIIVSKDAKWIKDKHQNPIQTIFPAQKFDLKEIESTESYVKFEISTEQPSNMKFIANELSVIEDIWMVELPTVQKDRTDIKLTLEEDVFVITYSLKPENCDIGCDKRHFWEFNVKANGEVSFIGEHGADLINPETDEKDFYLLLDQLQG